MRGVFACLVLLVGLVAAVHAEDSARPTRVPRIGYLETHPEWTPHFWKAMRDLGYVDGQNLFVEWRMSGDRLDQLPTFARELVALRVDVIFVDSTPAALAAKSATDRIPIVIAGLADPVGVGLVASLSRPGGNVTGTTIMNRDIVAKRVELLKETLPGMSTVAILWNPTHPMGAIMVKDAETAATRLGLRAHRVPVRRTEDAQEAFTTIYKRHASSFLITDDTFLINQSERLAALAIERRLPGISGFRRFVDVGGLMSFGASISEQFQRAAVHIDKILKGARPADLPVEQPTKFELLVNLTTAELLGITIPESVLLRADEVIR